MADERGHLTLETLDAMKAFVERTLEARASFQASPVASQATEADQAKGNDMSDADG